MLNFKSFYKFISYILLGSFIIIYFYYLYYVQVTVQLPSTLTEEQKIFLHLYEILQKIENMGKLSDHDIDVTFLKLWEERLNELGYTFNPNRDYAVMKYYLYQMQAYIKTTDNYNEHLLYICDNLILWFNCYNALDYIIYILFMIPLLRSFSLFNLIFFIFII